MIINIIILGVDYWWIAQDAIKLSHFPPLTSSLIWAYSAPLIYSTGHTYGSQLGASGAPYVRYESMYVEHFE
jgi:hypothetical protein